MSHTLSAPRGLRRGLTLIEVGVVVFILVVLAVLLIPQAPHSRQTARGNTCRNNMRALATALYNYQIRNGHYPGYMNALETANNRAFSDPTLRDSTDPVPVSWTVMILPDIDRQPLFDQWRGVRPDYVKSDAPRPSTYFTNQYIELFLCPNDVQPSKTGTPMSFVVNTGLPDAPAATADEPRDWAANGMFFDQFSEHLLVKPNAGERRPMVRMRDEMVADPKDKTILVTENVDATSYVLFANAHAAEGWRAAEVQTGCVWQPGAVDESKRPPTMTPPVASLQPNAELGRGDGLTFNHCRPSSRHPQSVNVAFVGQNISSLRDTISYYVYAKLMTSDDEHVRIPGLSAAESEMRLGRTWRTYEVKDEDVNP